MYSVDPIATQQLLHQESSPIIDHRGLQSGLYPFVRSGTSMESQEEYIRLRPEGFNIPEGLCRRWRHDKRV